MAWTDPETARIQAIETLLNKLQTAWNNLVSKTQFRQALLLRQEEIDALKARCTALESEVQLLQSRIP